MCTTLDIDDDVLAAAKETARVQRKTAGQVLSDLARKALTSPDRQGGGSAEEQALFDAEDELFPSFPHSGGAPVTSEMIRMIQDEIDIEDATPWDHASDQPRDFSRHTPK